MPPTPPPLRTINSPSPPTTLHTDPTLLPLALSHLNPSPTSSTTPSFPLAITTAFALQPTDTYTYHATAAVNLSQTQTAILAGAANGLHAWYVDASGKEREESARPTAGDVDAYLGLFDPGSRDAGRVLRGFGANARGRSVREGVAGWLGEKRFVVQDDEGEGKDAKGKGKGKGKGLGMEMGRGLAWPRWRKEKRGGKSWWNAYADFLGWVCRELEWCGPDGEVWRLGGKSHHVLPVMMHHFGCVCPTYEALGMVAGLAGMGEGGVARLKGEDEKGKGKGKGKVVRRGRVLDVGSGNGYWTYMLRQEPFNCEVVPVDNGQSAWRSTWVGDTLVVDAVVWLKKRPVEMQRDEVLLLVYPITAEEFTPNVIREFKGDVVCVAGTQNGSGYTGFKGEMVDQWFEREMGGWGLVARVPLLSFPGKDDALFVFRRKRENSATD